MRAVVQPMRQVPSRLLVGGATATYYGLCGLFKSMTTTTAETRKNLQAGLVFLLAIAAAGITLFVTLANQPASFDTQPTTIKLSSPWVEGEAFHAGVATQTGEAVVVRGATKSDGVVTAYRYLDSPDTWGAPGAGEGQQAAAAYGTESAVSGRDDSWLPLAIALAVLAGGLGAMVGAGLGAQLEENQTRVGEPATAL